MNVTQLTDAQLCSQADKLAMEFLATEESHPAFNRVCLAYDLVVRELKSRCMWD